MSGPLVSVVMIFLDAERFIDEAIASVRAQTYADWELLLVDDGSSDASTRIAKAAVLSDPARVRYLQHPRHVNRGMSASRNLGLAHAKGELVAFLDADDVFLPERLARHVALLQAHPEVAMVQSRYLMWFSWEGEGRPLDEDHLGPAMGLLDGVVPPPTRLALMLAVRDASPGICNITVRTSVALAVGGFEEPFRGLYEDQAFCAKIYLHHHVREIRDCLAHYRRHARSHTRRERGRELAARGRFLAWLAGHLDRVGADDPFVRRTLAGERARLGAGIRTPLLGLRRHLSARLADFLHMTMPQPIYLALVRARHRHASRRYQAKMASVLGRLEAPR